MDLSYITAQLAALTTTLNNIIAQAKKFSELTQQTSLNTSSVLPVENPSGDTEYVTVQQIIDAAGGGGSAGIYKTPVTFASAASGNFILADMFGAKPWNPQEPLKGFAISYPYNCWIFNDINTYDIFIRYSEETFIQGFVYTGFAQFANQTIKTCEIWAITDEADLNVIENFGVQANTTNLTKIWDSETGTDPAFPSAVIADYYDFLTDPALSYDLASPINCYGLVFRPKTNHGDALKTCITKLLFF